MGRRTSYTPGTPSWIDLGAPDVDAAVDFYSALFGWVGEDQGAAAGRYHIMRQDGEAVAGIGPIMGPDQPTAWTTYISVTSADETADKIKAAGGTILMPPMDVMDVGRMAVFMDSVQAVAAVWEPRLHIGAGLVNEPNALCWNELTVRDVETAKTFYNAVFGWVGDTGTFDGMEYTTWMLGDAAVGGMMQMDETWPPEIPSHWMPYIAVEDADASAALCVDLGGTVVVPPTDIPPGRFAVLNDPAGAVLSIMRLLNPDD